jgi:DNA helicase-2/ATP-dependent DNA helicase PcrA
MKGSRIPSKGSSNLITHLKQIASFSRDDSPSELLQVVSSLLEDYIKTQYENSDERLDDLEELGIYAQNYPTIRRFLETLSLNKNNIGSKSVKAGKQSEHEKPMVLSTIHRAKGLEWRAVFIPMLCEGYFPSYRVTGDRDAIEEERRVFYVAVTRAKDQLFLISPSLVQSWDGYRTAKNSEFIEELDPSVYQKSSVKFKRRDRANFFTADELLK